MSTHREASITLGGLGGEKDDDKTDDNDNETEDRWCCGPDRLI